MQRALGQTNTTAKRIEDRFAQTQVKIGQRFSTMGASIGAAFASAAALRGAQQLIDASTRVENSLKVAGLSGSDLTKVYDGLFASAQRNSAPLEALAQLYGRATLSQKDLKASSADLLKFTENVSLALRVNGASAEQSSGALLQLSQLLGSGTVRAEEFNSVQEGALPVLQAVAAGLKEAGGSVATLRSLVIDGKVSSAAFFAAFEEGSAVLTEKVAGAETTVSQSFIRLQNVLIDVAGKFNTGTGASASFARSLDQLGAVIAGLPDNQGFNDFIEFWNDFGNNEFSNTAREFGQIAAAIEAVKSAFTDVNAEVNITASQAGTAQTALEQFAIANGGVFSSEVEAAFRDLIAQLAAGKGNAEKATAAIMAMGAADPNFDKVIGKVSILINTFIALRDAATAALTVGSQVTSSTPQSFAGQEGGPSRATSTVKPLTLDDYPIVPGGGSGGGSKGRQSPSQKFADDLAEQERRTEQLRQQTALQSTLNVLVNDYGFAVEKLRVQQDLENDATKAGLELTPDRKEAIETLATSYAQASVEAAKLAEAQDNAKQTMADFTDMAKSSLRGFIDDLREGKSASEALSNALASIGDRLLDMSLDALFGGGQGGFNILSLFGFANGGIAAHGKPRTFARGGVASTASIFGEAGPEAAVPLPDGRRIPVDLRMPSLPAMSSPAQAVHVTVGVSADSAGNLTPFVESVSQRTVAQAAPTLISASVSQANKSAPSAMAKYQQERQGSDYRNG